MLVQIAKVSISTLVPVRQQHVNGIFTSLSTVAARKIWEAHLDASSITPELLVWSKSRFTLFRLKCTFLIIFYVFNSFGYPAANTATSTAADSTHLQNQNYQVCVRRNAGMFFAKILKFKPNYLLL